MASLPKARRLRSITSERSMIMTMITVHIVIASFGISLVKGQCPSSISSMSMSINDFGFDLGRELMPSYGNFFMSPFSIYAAMAMVYDGTAGCSSAQIASALRLTDNDLSNDDLKVSFQDMLDTYLKRNTDYNLTVANGVFVQEDYPLKDTFVDDMDLYYRALVQTLDFVDDGDAAKAEINDWVSEITRGKIKDMFAEPLDPLTKLILINAIYFKGTWKIQFNKDSTYDGTFYNANNGEKKVKLMRLKKQKFFFCEDVAGTDYKFLEMPYKGGDISMLLALPKNRNQYPDLEMNSETFCSIRDSLRNVTINRLVVPKFKFQYEKQLRGVLETLGIKDIFIAGTADLTGIADDAQQKLYVSSVLHKALIDVNEEGSEAAAATGVTIVTRMMPVAPPPEIEFIADHPFLFYIIDKRNGVIVFSGRVDDPS